MNSQYSFRLAILMLVMSIVLPIPASSGETGAPFAVTDEQLDHIVPIGWKLAWMSGSGDGSYIAEYIPEAEEINAWRDGYLAIERVLYPPAECRRGWECAGFWGLARLIPKIIHRRFA